MGIVIYSLLERLHRMLNVIGTLLKLLNPK
jgi:hypothetical protein